MTPAKDEHSVFNFYRKAIALRKELACAQLVLQNYKRIDSAKMRPYEVRVHL